MPGPVTKVAAIDALLNPLGYEQITDLSSAIGLTIPSGATHALIHASSQNVRWRDDGTNPTDGVGMPLIVDTGMWYSGGDLSALKFIEETASAVLDISYYKT